MQLLEAILRDFGVPIIGKSRLALISELNRFLLQESGRSSNIVLIIDEAQNLKPQTLEQIRLLSNLETEKDKLIQIVLVGQPELNHRLGLYELRQLQQRIAVRCHITPLEKEEIKEYINCRLNVAGANNRILFSDEACEAIYHFSRGTPRLVNIICDRALLAGFTAETFNIDMGIVSRALGELGSYFVTHHS